MATTGWKAAGKGIVSMDWRYAFRYSYFQTYPPLPRVGYNLTDPVQLNLINIANGIISTTNKQIKTTYYNTDSSVDILVGEINNQDFLFNVAISKGFPQFIKIVHQACCRLSTLMGAQSDQPFIVSSLIGPYLSDGTLINNSPVAFVPYIKQLILPTTSFSIYCYDPDGDTLYFEITPIDSSGIFPPVGLTINSRTGVISWPNASSQQRGFYALQITIWDTYPNATKKSYMVADFLLHLIDHPIGDTPTITASNNGVIISDASTIEADHHSDFIFTVSIRDSNIVSVFSLPTQNLATFNVTFPLNNVNSPSFKGTISSANLGSSIGIPIVFQFQVQDITGLMNDITFSVLPTRPPCEVDTTPPTISITNAASEYECNIDNLSDDAIISILDNCDPSPTFIANNSIISKQPGDYTIRYTASDASGNTDFLDRAFSIKDTIAPTLSFDTTSTYECKLSSSDFTDTISVFDVCNSSPTFTASDNIFDKDIGDYSISYIASDSSGNTQSYVRSFSVVDTIAPTLSYIGSSSVECGSIFSFENSQVEVSDKCDSNPIVTSSNSIDTSVLGDYPIVIMATDFSGNSNSIDQSISVVDRIAPTIESGDITVECGSPLSNFTVSDICDSNPSVSYTGIINTSSVGDYPITIIARDESGNIASKSATISVVDTTPLEIKDFTASPSILYPANHQYVFISLNYAIEEACSISASCSLDVKSNEPDNTKKGGDKANDIIIYSSTSIALRAERIDNGNGRTYTITLNCSDGSFKTSAVTTVFVPILYNPHDHITY